MGGPWLPIFEGKTGEKVGEWRAKIEMFVRAQGLSNDQIVDFILSALGGEAKREMLLLPLSERDTGKKILDCLTSLYAGSQSLATLRAQFYECRQGAEEGMGTFILRFRELYHKWQAREPPAEDIEDELLRTQFIRGLQESLVKQELKRLLRRTPGMTFPAICTEAKALEREQAKDGTETWACRTYAPRPPQTQPPATPLCSLVPPPAQDSQALWDSLRAELQQDLKDQMLTLGKSLMEEMRGQIANLSLGPADSTVQRQNPQAGPAFQPRPRQPPLVTARTQFQWDPQGRPICLECGQAGHTRRFCSRRRSGPSDF
nr:uncharacterized protein LOC117447178 [Pseudochaenichthys georgianus]XP_033939733.1 uncharacterized protein LOC117447178 [Pseudochaenichthys georgianus]XP_033939734.1 uncharacterized protein LOC117447178 [Pseudochaenichthys georgianus]